MKITVSEALRLKKEVSSIINKTILFTKSFASVGNRFEDDVIVSDQKAIPITEAVATLEQLIAINAELNNQVDVFNHTNNIPELVRSKKNAQLLLDILTGISKRSQPTSVNKNKTLHDKVVVVLEKFEPFLPKKELRHMIKKQKSTIRTLQGEIDKANTFLIEVSFDYDTLSELEEVADSYSSRPFFD